jgi:hypothetical protein
MKKIAYLSLFLVCIAGAASAQINTAATQTVNISMSNAVEISFTSTGTTTGSTVNMAFNTVTNYASGVESDAQEMKVRSNKNFSVTVKSNSTNFTYSGSTTPSPTMPVSGVLAIMVTANSTLGSIASPFSSTTYAGITSANQNLITNGSRGGNQKFSVKYKATPDFNYPAGTYTVSIVYTATQI